MIDTTEVWKEIPGFNGRYQVSNTGRVKSNSPKMRGRDLSSQQSGRDYTRVDLQGGGEDGKFKRSYFIHKLVAEAFIPNPNKLEMVNHKDGTKNNNHVDNLEWISKGENAAHGFLMKGRSSMNYRINTLRYLHKVYNFESIESMFHFLDQFNGKTLTIEGCNELYTK